MRPVDVEVIIEDTIDLTTADENLRPPGGDEITIEGTVDPTTADDKVHKNRDVGKHISKYIHIFVLLCRK